MDLRGSEFLSELRLLMPTFSLPTAPPHLAMRLQRDRNALLPQRCKTTQVPNAIIRLNVVFVPFISSFFVVFWIIIWQSRCSATLFASSAPCLAPMNFRRFYPRIVSCYTLFKGWLLLSQPPICLGIKTTFHT